MIRALIICFLLTGCGVPSTNVSTVSGEPVDTAYLVMAPLCLFICPITVTTTGSDVDTIGQGASGTNTQTASVSTGAVNGGN